ncbi:MAG: hypothetical protein ABI183_12330 [Polyangiaceae bacterium]
MTLDNLPNAISAPTSHLFASAATSQATGPSQFRPVTGGEEMQSGGRLLVEAYAAIWLVLLALVLVMWRRTRAIEHRIAALDEAVRRADVQNASSEKSEPKKRAPKKSEPVPDSADSED